MSWPKAGRIVLSLGIFQSSMQAQINEDKAQILKLYFFPGEIGMIPCLTIALFFGQSIPEFKNFCHFISLETASLQPCLGWRQGRIQENKWGIIFSWRDQYAFFFFFLQANLFIYLFFIFSDLGGTKAPRGPLPPSLRPWMEGSSLAIKMPQKRWNLNLKPYCLNQLSKPLSKTEKQSLIWGSIVQDKHISKPKHP